MDFWDVFILLLVYVPLALLWGFTLVDIFQRGDLTGVKRALWVCVVIVLPFFGTIGYLISRPASPPDRAWAATSAELDNVSRLHDAGKLSDREFELAKARLLGSHDLPTLPTQPPATAVR